MKETFNLQFKLLKQFEKVTFFNKNWINMSVLFSFHYGFEAIDRKA